MQLCLNILLIQFNILKLLFSKHQVSSSMYKMLTCETMMTCSLVLERLFFVHMGICWLSAGAQILWLYYIVIKSNLTWTEAHHNYLKFSFICLCNKLVLFPLHSWFWAHLFCFSWWKHRCDQQWTRAGVFRVPHGFVPVWFWKCIRDLSKASLHVREMGQEPARFLQPALQRPGKLKVRVFFVCLFFKIVSINFFTLLWNYF